MSDARLVPGCRALVRVTKKRGLLRLAIASLLGLFRRPKRVVVLCSRCHRPLSRELGMITERTETCVPCPRFVRVVTASSKFTYWTNTDVIECSVWVRFPAWYAMGDVPG